MPAAIDALAPRNTSAAGWAGIIQTQARRGLRLLKEFSGYNAATDMATLQPGGTLWNLAGAELPSGTCDSAVSQNLASWSDCSASGYTLRFLTPPANTMTMQIGML